MAQAEVFGVDLIAYVLAQDKIQMDFKDVVVATLQDTDVRNETVNVLQYILSQKDSEEMLALYLNTVLLRPDILENMTILLTDSTCQSIADEKTKKYF